MNIILDYAGCEVRTLKLVIVLTLPADSRVFFLYLTEVMTSLYCNVNSDITFLSNDVSEISTNFFQMFIS